MSVFWPLFPYDIMPLKEGEHAYVIFEDNDNRTHGLWLTRIPENNKINQLNLVPGEKKYQNNPDNNTSDVGIDQAAQGSDLAVTQPKQSGDFTKEEVPDFTARVGDRAIFGSNNTLILLSRDRVSDPASGQKDGAGTIFLIAGRKDKEKINLKDDEAFIVISSKTDIDTNFDIQAGDPKNSVSTVAIKANEIRISARAGMKIVVDQGDVFIKNDGKITLEATGNIDIKSTGINSIINIDAPGLQSKVNVGGTDANAILGNDLVDTLKNFFQSSLTHQHPGPMPVGPSPDYAAAATPAMVKLGLPPGTPGGILSNAVKLKRGLPG